MVTNIIMIISTIIVSSVLFLIFINIKETYYHNQVQTTDRLNDIHKFIFDSFKNNKCPEISVLERIKNKLMYII